MKKILLIIVLTFMLCFTCSCNNSHDDSNNINKPNIEESNNNDLNIDFNEFKVINQKNSIYEFKPYGYINLNITVSKNRVSEEKSLFLIDIREDVTPGACANYNGNNLYGSYLLDSGYMHIKVLQASKAIDQETTNYGAKPKVLKTWPYNIDEYHDSQINSQNAFINFSRGSTDYDELQWHFKISDSTRRKMTFPLVSMIIFEMDNHNHELDGENSFSLKVDFGINFNKKIEIKNGKEVLAKKIEKNTIIDFS